MSSQDVTKNWNYVKHLEMEIDFMKMLQDHMHVQLVMQNVKFAKEVQQIVQNVEMMELWII